MSIPRGSCRIRITKRVILNPKKRHIQIRVYDKDKLPRARRALGISAQAAPPLFGPSHPEPMGQKALKNCACSPSWHG
ncbi:hypothetical protein NPIL_620721 [Nephila pilipes]|uniref:Uncharacterized protein n=1 Tax=Nephila pilipes TaxID=299642 RepID=A0A8X6TMI4_NEPPI|nr:hypothetical protein NPIL_620721 [Nephila pilipes]